MSFGKTKKFKTLNLKFVENMDSWFISPIIWNNADHAFGNYGPFNLLFQFTEFYVGWLN